MKKYTATKIGLFDTVIEISGYTESEERFNEVKAEVFARLGDLHQDFDIYNSYGITHNTNLARVNASAGSEYRSHIISREVYELLTFGKEIYSLTNGKVNIAMGSVLSLWRDCLNAEPPHIPDAEALANAAAHTDINDFYIADTKDGFLLTVYDTHLTFDVGAIAKGYAAKKAVELISSIRRDGESFLLNIGGMVCPIGEKPNNEPWQVGIEYPTTDRNGEYIRQIEMSDGSLVTSASHLRTFTVDGKSYGHIIDPETFYPPEYFASVTVRCSDPAMGDALSTALFCMIEAEGRKLIAKLDGISVMWVYPDMRVSTTENFG